jgi:hypothetical protein
MLVVTSPKSEVMTSSSSGLLDLPDLPPAFSASSSFWNFGSSSSTKYSSKTLSRGVPFTIVTDGCLSQRILLTLAIAFLPIVLAFLSRMHAPPVDVRLREYPQALPIYLYDHLWSRFIKVHS